MSAQDFNPNAKAERVPSLNLLCGISILSSLGVGFGRVCAVMLFAKWGLAAGLKTWLVAVV